MTGIPGLDAAYKLTHTQAGTGATPITFLVFRTLRITSHHGFSD